MKRFRDLICYPGLLPFEPDATHVESFMRGMKRAGVTHVQVNHLPDLMHPELLNQPENVYLWFANFGPPLDLFVSSKLNAGLWPEMFLERNQRILLRFAAAARSHGIKPLLYLCEPRFVPERFFAKHPTLRGPRVDNPTCSTRPLYALCTDLPEVQEHYREMMRRMMDLVPDLSLVSLFTSDSGAGFDYNPDTYAGANGAGFNRRVPLASRVNRFLNILLEEGRRRTPDFTVNLTSGFSPEDRERILASAPQGVVGSVYGLYDWEGGLEEQWGYHQAVWGEPQAPYTVRTLDREAAARWRFEDYKRRFEVAAAQGGEPIAHAELPSTDYPRPLRYTPHPFETARIVQQLDEIGVNRLAMWGVTSSEELVPQDINLEVFQAMQNNPEADPGEIVQSMARDWVGEAHAAPLVEAWKICDRAWTRRPLWNHVGLCKVMMPGPLVPDMGALTRAETAYYRTVALDDLERIQGIGALVPHEPDERNRDHVLDQFYHQDTLPELERAITLLRQAAANANEQAGAVLGRQADHILCGWLIQRSARNWYEAGRYLAPGRAPRLDRSMREIMEDELETTRDLIALLDGQLEQFFRIYPSDNMTYEFGPSFVDHLRERCAVMEKHQDDPPQALGRHIEKMSLYQHGEPA